MQRAHEDNHCWSDQIDSGPVRPIVRKLQVLICGNDSESVTTYHAIVEVAVELSFRGRQIWEDRDANWTELPNVVLYRSPHQRVEQEVHELDSLLLSGMVRIARKRGQSTRPGLSKARDRRGAHGEYALSSGRAEV